MRFRDVFWCVLLVVSVFTLYLITVPAVGEYRIDSLDVNREDSSRLSTTLLDDERWSEFHISSDALSIRLMTNGALTSTELPRESQTDPRSGWRYSVDYQVLDAEDNVLSESIYHLRSGVRELIDAETGELITPLVFGKTSMVATQTRLIQIPVSEKGARPSKIRLRVGEREPQIAEVVVRIRTRHERFHYDKASTWRNITPTTRSKLARFCVFDDKFLTKSERASLLRYYWVQAPPVATLPIRHLYIFGDADDQEVGDENVPIGTCLQPGWRSTVAVPQSHGEMRLTVQRTEPSDSLPVFLTGNWFDVEGNPPVQFESKTFENQMVIKQKFLGGILELESSEPVCFRCYWKNLDKNSTVHNDNGQPLAMDEEVELTKHAGQSSVRVYLVDQNGVSFPISHVADSPTPFRLSVRLGFGDAFQSEENLLKKNAGYLQPESWSNIRQLRWEYLDDGGNLIDHGDLEIVPEISPYDRLWKQNESHLVSERNTFYFSVPTNVSAIRLVSKDAFLLNASVRPSTAPWKSRVPEDRQPYERQNRRTRKWFGLKPKAHVDLIAGNRSFVLTTQSRVGIIDQDADADEIIDTDQFVWHRYAPRGDWIGRQILVPAENNSAIKRRSMFVWLFEASPNLQHLIQEYDFETSDDYRLTYISKEKRPGKLRVWQNGRLVQEESLVSTRGQVRLDLQRLSDNSTVRFECEQNTRLFFSGAMIDGAPRYLKRTACRLQHGELEFQYTKKTSEAETLTLAIYREQDAAERCQLEVKIIPTQGAPLQQTGPVEHLTILHRIYDLKARQQRHAVLLGSDTQLDVESKCTLQLGEDLPPGEYTIKTNRLDGNRRGFVLLYQLQPIVQDNKESL